MRRSRYLARGYGFIIFALMLAALSIATAAAVMQKLHDPKLLTDDFSGPPYRLTRGETSPNGLWYAETNGGGMIETIADPKEASGHQPHGVFYEWPSAPIDSNKSNSALTLTVNRYRDFHLAVDVKTDSQQRGNNSNHWEVAWVIWHWNDNTHFNYFVVKTNGAEAGKYDGGVNPTDQKILQTSSEPKATIGKWMHWDITVRGNHILAKVNGAEVFNFEDESSFSDGRIGLYCEDSVAAFDDVYLEELNQ